MTPSLVIVILLGLGAMPSIVDFIIRVVLAFHSRRFDPPRLPATTERCLIVIPARSEGTAVGPTLESARAALRPGNGIVLLLDGIDPEAEAIAASLGIATVEKNPSGPTKGAALGWFAQHCRERVVSYDVVMMLDAGSTLAPDFFVSFHWPQGCDAVQAHLRGEGTGAGEAAAASEAWAQRFEDRGRMSLGWNVRLRGTGMLLTSESFLDIAPRLQTTVEDWEMSLLLTAGGRRASLAPAAANVYDIKPHDVWSAAAQRSRWLFGQFSLLLKQHGAIAQLIRREPLQGMAFVAELFSRPRSLSVAIRLAVAVALLAWRVSPFSAIFATAVLVTVVIDAGSLMFGGGVRPRSLAALFVAWLGAVVFFPWAVAHWLRARRR